jgi:hypothetical protein
VLEGTARMNSAQLTMPVSTTRPGGKTPVAAVSFVGRLEAVAPHLYSSHWRPRTCDVAALIRVYGAAGDTQAADALTWTLVGATRQSHTRAYADAVP